MQDMIRNRQLDQAIAAEAFAHYSEAQLLLQTTEPEGEAAVMLRRRTTT